MRPVTDGWIIAAGADADARPVPWKPVRFFRLSERRQAERAARRLQDASGRPVRVVGTAGRGLKLLSGDDERREQRPVERDRRHDS